MVVEPGKLLSCIMEVSFDWAMLESHHIKFSVRVVLPVPGGFIAA